METTSRTCRWVCRRLPLLAGGDLVGSERRRVERHLIACPSCRSRRTADEQSLAVLRGTGSLGVRSASATDISSLWPALARQIREAKHRPGRPAVSEWVRPGNLAPLAGWIGAGLAASLILGCGWFWSHGSTTARPEMPPGTASASASRPVSSGPTVPAEQMPETLIADNSQILRLFDELDVAALQLLRRPSALPEVTAARNDLSARSGVDPFDPPRSLRLDYDLDWGTLSGPNPNTQRAY